MPNHLKFLLAQAYPRRIVGVGIDYCANVTLLQIALHLRPELVSTEGVDVERLVLHAHHLQLHLLHGEAGVDEENGVLLGVALRTGEERGEGALHGAAHRHTALRGYVDAYECLDESRGFLLEHRITLYVGIGMGNALPEGINLGVYANLGGRQPRNAHLHLNILHSALLLGVCRHLLHLADGGLGKVVDSKLLYQPVNDFFFYRCLFHDCCVVCFLVGKVNKKHGNCQIYYCFFGGSQHFEYLCTLLQSG